MERLNEPAGTRVWRCKLCKKSHVDKTKIRKHVKSNHLTNNEQVKMEAFYSVSFKDGESVVSTDEEFQTKVLSLMDKEEGLNHRVTWFCKKCERSASDKSRIRKHVESHIDGLSFDCMLCEIKKSSSNNMNVHVSKFHTKQI